MTKQEILEFIQKEFKAVDTLRDVMKMDYGVYAKGKCPHCARKIRFKIETDEDNMDEVINSKEV